MSKQIEEVMELVSAYSYATAEVAESNTASQLEKAHANAIAAHKAIESKLRELLPVWQPIETAPVNKTLMLGFKNEQGNWRSTRGCWMDEVEIASWEHDESPVGWYETPTEGEECFYIEPTHWMPLPKDPE